jgi:hypothetical protein
MRLNFLTAFCCLFFVACNNSGKKSESRNRDSVINSDTVARPAFVRLNKSEIPAEIKLEGQIIESIKWKDNSGENVFIITKLGPGVHKDEFGEEVHSAFIHATHYTNSNGRAFSELWRNREKEAGCGFDITCDMLPGSLTLTDLDGDGITEVKYQLALACRSDVSPAYMKLIMHEGNESYTLSGNMWIAYSPEIRYDVTAENVNLEKLPPLNSGDSQLLRTFGRYESEKSFNNAPAAFLEFARAEWLKYSIEKLPS